MQIWPAIDIRDGKCVRLKQGDYQQETVYGESPVEMAMHWVDQGAQFLHLVDLDAARDGSSANFDAIAKVAKQLNIPVQIGGGIRDEQTIQKYIDAGIQRLVVGTRALKDPDWAKEVIKQFPNQIVIGLDSRDGKAATDGWLETSEISDLEFAKDMAQFPIAGIVYTDITKDGMLSGPNFEALELMNDSVNVPVIASGGVTTVEDISQLASKGLAGCIVGRTLYEGRLTLGQAIKAAATGVSTS